MNGIEVKGVSKNFGTLAALTGVNVLFEENRIYGLLGRNGAGKSTLLNVITGRIFAEQGTVTVDGEVSAENDRALKNIYMMSEKNYFPEGMKVRDAFKWTKEFYPAFDRAYADSLSAKFELNTNKKIKSLSTGYASIFKLITALATNAKYILLDEPILGLDANHRDLFYRTLIEKYSENPCTIVISTHLIEEAAGVLDHVVILKNGEVIRNESKDDLLAGSYMVSGVAAAVDAYCAGRNVLGSDSLGGLKTAYVEGAPDASGVPEGLTVSRMDLQKLFIQLTNA